MNRRHPRRRRAPGALAVVGCAVIFTLAHVTPVSVQDRTVRLEEYLSAAAALGRFSGSVLVAHNGTVLVRKGYGMANLELGSPNTPETKFRIGSVTKPFTATAVMILQERGRLNVSDPVCKHLAECPAIWREISLHHLLSHTSGIPNYAGFPDYVTLMREQTDVPGLIARFRDKPLDFAPGSDYRYSNSGYILLGHVIERVSGQGYGQFVRAAIFEPLGMANSGYDVPTRVLAGRASGYSRAGGTVINAPFIAMSTVHSAGALFSTVDDLYAFDHALRGDTLLTPKSRATMFTPVRNGSGYGWGVGEAFGRRHVAHNGQVNGFTSILSRYPDDAVTIVVLTNSDQTIPGIDRVARDLAAIVFGAPLRASAAPANGDRGRAHPGRVHRRVRARDQLLRHNRAQPDGAHDAADGKRTL